MSRFCDSCTSIISLFQSNKKSDSLGFQTSFKNVLENRSLKDDKRKIGSDLTKFNNRCSVLG